MLAWGYAASPLLVDSRALARGRPLERWERLVLIVGVAVTGVLAISLVAIEFAEAVPIGLVLTALIAPCVTAVFSFVVLVRS